MKIYLFVLSILLFIVSCGNTQTNKIEGTASKKVATGTGEELTVDTQASIINWRGTKPGGEHTGTINIKEGKLTIKGTEVTSGSFVVDMNTITNTDLTEADMNKMLVDHLKSPDFFDIAKYPEATFIITKVEPSHTVNDSLTHLVSGNLKMKDIEKNITFGAKITKEGEVYKAVSEAFSIDRTQWNVKYGSKTIFANLKDKIIDDNIGLEIIIIAKPDM